MLTLPRVDDFDLVANAPAWNAADWQPVPTTTGEPGHSTRFRAVYSATGIYVGFECHDHRQVTTGLPDGGDLWDEDVVEAFFWPDEARPLYLEYELSPAGSELLLLVPNCEGEFMGWSPWHYEGDRKTRRSVRNLPTVRANVGAGSPRPPTAVAAPTATPFDSESADWSADFYIPFTLFKGLCKTPPARGTIWRTNFCRIDHDRGSPQLYSWSPGIGTTFHDLSKFGQIRFG